jgi:DNA recombination-dependent growth factor C
MSRISNALILLVCIGAPVGLYVATAPARMEREAIAKSVTKRAFRESDPEVGDPRQAWGWVTIHDPLATSFGAADLFFHHYLVLGFRYDKRLVPPKLLMLERRRLENERKAARGVTKLGAAERREIKDAVAHRLVARALPTPRLFDVVWNLQTGRVYFSGKLRAARDAFADCFRETFGVAPVPLIPYLAAEHVGLGTREVEAVRAVEPSSFGATSEAPAGEDVPRLPLEQAEYEPDAREDEEELFE